MADTPRNWRTVLGAKEVPYLLTVLLALAGWNLQHVVERLLASPTLAYDCQAESGQRVACSLLNVSRDRLLEHIRLILPADQWGGVSAVRIESERPCYDSSAEPVISAGSAELTIARLDPGCAIRLVFDRTSPVYEVQPRLVSALGPVRFEPSSMSTYLVAHEVGVMVGLALLWLGLAVIHLRFWKGGNA